MTEVPKPLNVHDVPGLGDRRTKALKIQGATDWWFYPLLLAVAAALITASLGFAPFVRGGAPQKAERDGATYVFNAGALAGGIDPADGHLRHVTRDLGVSARAVRVGVRPGVGAPGPNSAGAVLMIDPADAAALTGRPLHVEVSIKRINVTTATSLAVSMQNGAATTWVSAAIPAENGVMAFDLPASAGPLAKGLGLWLVNDKTDYNYGVEITRIAITPAG
ncbi:MAG: hypothetical protein IV086_11805 [Hyphomonadaceae bacterium]|nr:MAG: hypothetical protein FD160_2476 [Caulobacteraceae bacterium]MBT9446375.1 hypothetical protein [Hyphomonadaceae bacterium]TPW07865.1 MAG: hypothetical protein FD124_813 [Alphaproteobacteria bacterium]